MLMYRVSIVLLALLGATPGKATVIINRADIGAAISVDYAGAVLGIPTSSLGALSNFVYTGASSDGRTYNFSYTLTNDSAATSRLRSFGFDVLGSTALTGATSTGTYATTIQNPLSGLIGTDLCFAAGSLGTCATGTGGLSAGQATTGSFALSFADAMASVQLNDFAVSFQGVNGLLAGSGTGSPVLTLPATTPAISLAPESATWMMMIGGFGLIGWMSRRRRPPAQSRVVTPNISMASGLPPKSA